MDELSQVALVGTQQAGPALPASEPAVEGLFAGLAATGRERELLLRAGAAAVYRRAGFSPRRIAQLPAAAAADERPACGPATTAILRALFDGLHAGVLPEALGLLSRARLRLSPELLPAALDISHRQLRDHLRPVLGERGRWLASLEPAWAWAHAAVGDSAVPADADVRWQEARHEERMSLLAQARRLDVVRSRAWLAATWSQEKAEYRAEMLAVLEVGLALADEAFLVAALGDRSASVRVVAARLLWRLPGSALSGQMRMRADRLIAGYRPARTGPGTLDVRLPRGSFDPAWSREGLIEQPPQGHKLGRRQWWLVQTVAAVPPSHWETRLAAPAADLALAARAHEYGDVLIDGLTAAALAHGTNAWFEPLWEIWFTRSRPGSLFAAPLAELLARMPEEAQIRRACQLLASGAENIGALAALARPWPGAVADAFLAAFPQVPRLEDRGGAHPWEAWLGRAALALPPSHLARTLAMPDPHPTDWQGRRLIRLIDEFHAVLEFRRRLHEEIRREHEQDQERP